MGAMGWESGLVEEEALHRESPTERHRRASDTWLMRGMIIFGAALFITAAIGLAALAWFQKNSGTVSIHPPTIGSTLADFSLKDLDGKSVRLSDYSGRPVLINTWASWCPPCRAEAPDLIAFYEAHKDSGLVVLAINVGESQTVAQKAASDLGFPFPVLLDPEEALMDAWRVNNYPTSILIGPDGIVKMVHIGLLTSEDFEKKIKPWVN